MASLILINAVSISPTGLVWPGTLYDTVNDAAQYNAALNGGGIFWPQSDAVVEAQRVIVQQHRLAGGLPLPAAQSMMFAAVLASVNTSSTGSAAALAAAVAAQADATAALSDASDAQDTADAAVIDAATAQATADAAVPLASVQLVQNLALVAGTVTRNTTITVTDDSVIVPIRNNPDPVATNWGALSISARTSGAPGVGSVTVSSSDAGDTSSVDILIIG